MLRALLVFILGLVVVLLAALRYGAYRWTARTRDLRSRLIAARVPMEPRDVDFRELEFLPAPVQRYFRAVLQEGQPMVAAVRLQHNGTFNLDETGDRWRPFTSDQEVVTRRPGFDWDARIAMMPGVTVRVHDAYVAGEGILHASLLGLVSLADLHGTGDVAEGELMRFFAEAAWYPTALLPSQGVHWEAADARSAYGTLADGPLRVRLLFTFTREGWIDSIQAEARGRIVGNKVVPTPWHGRFWSYEKRGNLHVPLDGEVAWLLPEGPKPYWRGHIIQIAYEPVR